jgi:hypothetical protein
LWWRGNGTRNRCKEVLFDPVDGATTLGTMATSGRDERVVDMRGISNGGAFVRLDGDDASRSNGHAPAGGGRSGTALLTRDELVAEDDLLDETSVFDAPGDRVSAAYRPTLDLFPPGLGGRSRHGGRRVVGLATAAVTAMTGKRRSA